ncbi:MAG: alanine--glyoxylate aminotransferase family protein [Candidatus Saganbacteria bacterium]|nr:alanine--glyoxylate aminotransferase family protein [Candidatus Saganbacteria bacterium]
MAFKEYLMIPGPTPVPTRVLSAMNKQMINHRGPSFSSIIKEIVEGVKWAYQTQNDIITLTTSGTGGMEAAIVNFLSPGDKVLSLNIGAFGNRFAKIARAYGADVDEVKFERGKAVDLKTVEQKLNEDKAKVIKAVLIQQNETSTGVLNDVKSVAQLVNKHGALMIVDAVSGLLTAPLKTDEWGLDVVVSGSQKAFMVPPGLAFVSVNKKAWAANEKAKMPRFYFDFKQAMKFAEIGETPWTPAVSIIYAMQEAIRMLKEEGIENIYARHEKLAKAVRAGVKALGLKLLVNDESIASKAVTPVFPPDGIEADKLRKAMREKYGIVLAGGQEDLKGKLFRIGHLGYIDKMEVIAALAALEIELGSSVKKGAGVAAAEEAMA